MTNKFKCSTFFLLCFCVMQYSSAILAIHIRHTPPSIPNEFKETIKEFLNKRDAGTIPYIYADSKLLSPVSIGSFYQVNNKYAADFFKQYCPAGYSFNKSRTTKAGTIFFDDEILYTFKLKKYNSRAADYLPAEQRNFYGKIWKIILRYPNGIKQYYVFFDYTNFNGDGYRKAI
jgi:hypothetical protein